MPVSLSKECVCMYLSSCCYFTRVTEIPMQPPAAKVRYSISYSKAPPFQKDWSAEFTKNPGTTKNVPVEVALCGWGVLFSIDLVSRRVVTFK